MGEKGTATEVGGQGSALGAAKGILHRCPEDPSGSMLIGNTHS